MAEVSPYLHFNGNCEEAFEFYKSVFGGEYMFLGRYNEAPPAGAPPLAEGEGEKIMHVTLPVGKGTFIMGSDVPTAFGKANFGSNFFVSINTESKDEATRIFDGLSAGGKVLMPLESTFWGAYFGMFVDKFGVQWMVNFDERK